MSTEIQVDDETRAALLLFNERVEASAAEERAKKRIGKAERQKDEAASVVRKMNDNPNASAEDKAEAEAAYKTAVENYQFIKANPDAGQNNQKKKDAPAEDAPAAEAAADEEAAPAAEEAAAPVEEAAASADDAPAAEEDPVPAEAEAAPTEVSADEEPAPAAAAAEESE